MLGIAQKTCAPCFVCHSATCQSGVTNSPFEFGGSREPEPTWRIARCSRESYSHEPSGKGSKHDFNSSGTDGSARKATRTAHPRPYLVIYKCTYGETVGRTRGWAS